MNIAIEGCAHGELDIIYRTIGKLEEVHQMKIDLLICCGDFQSVRNEQDLKCMAVPLKFMQMHDFHQYYSGEKMAPVLTIFIGGNHEASNYLQELPYGGWVAPNIFFLGRAGVINVNGLRIGGLSGIYNGSNYAKGHYERSAYTTSSIKSVYHIRNLEVFRLKQISGHMDIFMSHDWPKGIYHHGNTKSLLSQKPFFKKEIEDSSLGSPAAEDLIHCLQPDYWFSGHLHVKFAAILKHNNQKQTRFLALDKCLPRREFLQILTLPSNNNFPLEVSYDPEWLTILRLTNHLLSTSSKMVYMPGPGSNERFSFTPSNSEMDDTLQKLGGSWIIPQSNFVHTAKIFNVIQGLPDMSFVDCPKPVLNPQTTNLCLKLKLDDPVLLLLNTNRSLQKNGYNSLYLEERSSDLVYENLSNSLQENSSLFKGTGSSNSSVSLNETEADESCSDSSMKLSKDSLSGDFILELSESDISESPDKDISVFSPIRSFGFHSRKKFSPYGPMSSSPRYFLQSAGA